MRTAAISPAKPVSSRAIDVQKTFWKTLPSPLLAEGWRIPEHYLTVYRWWFRPCPSPVTWFQCRSSIQNRTRIPRGAQSSHISRYAMFLSFLPTGRIKPGPAEGYLILLGTAACRVGGAGGPPPGPGGRRSVQHGWELSTSSLAVGDADLAPAERSGRGRRYYTQPDNVRDGLGETGTEGRVVAHLLVEQVHREEPP